jgi:hypothetical protein
MSENPTLLLIQRKKLLYDIGYFGFKVIHAIISTLIIVVGGYFNLGTIITMILFLVFFFGTWYLIFNKMYGSWLVNYKVIGSLELNEEIIIVNSEDGIQSYTIKNFTKIILKQNYYQNYSKYKSPIYDGIGSLTIDLGTVNKVRLEFLIRNSEELESFNRLKQLWKQNGLSIWT